MLRQVNGREPHHRSTFGFELLKGRKTDEALFNSKAQ